MKKLLFTLALLLTGLSGLKADIAINSTNFPDAEFREVLADFDTNHDGYLSVSEIAAITELEIYIESQSFQGIEYLTALESLVCGGEFTTLDLSANRSLKSLDIEEAYELTTLDLSANTALESLTVINTEITSLNLSANTALESLTVSST